MHSSGQMLLGLLRNHNTIRMIEVSSRRFCTVSIPQHPSKYSDKYEMSSDEVSDVLKKKVKKSKQSLVMVASEVNEEHPPSYDQDINQTLSEIKARQKNSPPQQSASRSLINQSEEDKLPTTGLQGQTRVAVKYYKYELPIPNIDPEIQGVVDPFERAQKEFVTSNQRLWALLNLNENTPYDAYELALRHKFNNEIDMYGDLSNEAAIRAEQMTALGDGAVPMFHLKNSEYMERMRREQTVNFNMPGAVELEHPHKFLKDLRPIEDFRHTPLIPISDRQMREHQQKVEAQSRRGFYYEIKRDTVYNALLAGVAMSIGFYMISLVLKKEEESGIAVERLKIERRNIGLAQRQ